MQTTFLHYRIERRDIAFLRFILEGYDGVAVMTTLDASRGTVRLAVAPGCLDVVSSLLSRLAREMRIETLDVMETEV